MPMSQTREEILLDHDESSNFHRDSARLERWMAMRNHLLARRMHILWWTLAGTIVAALLTFKLCHFEGVAQLMPPDSSSGGLASLVPSLVKTPGLAGLSGLAGDLLGTKSTGALFAKVLQSRTVEDNLISKFDLRKRYGQRYFEGARKVLASRTSIAEDKKSGVLTITVTDDDPEFSAKLAAAYVQELDRVMLQVATSSARREREFIELRLQEEKKILDESEGRFSRFASTSMALDIPQQTRVMVEAAARLQGELIAARAELEGLEQVYTGDNIRVRSVRAKVNELQRALDRLNAGQTQVPDGTNRSPYPSIKNLPLVGVEWTDLYRNTKIHETVYEMLTQQYEIARIQEARETPTVKILDAPVVPEKRHPGRALVVGIGVVVSLLLACGGQVLHFRWQSLDFDDPRRRFLATFFRA